MEESRIATPIGSTLDRFIKLKEDAFPYASGELSQLLRDIALASKVVNRELNKAGLITNIAGSQGNENVQGEDQQKLDLLANIRFVRALKKGGEVCAIISEEVEELILTDNNDAKYIVAMDPLDGSSNIDVNVSVGTIFSIYRRKSPVGSVPTKEDALQRGVDQVASGYVIYGSSTMLVFTTGNGVYGFTFDQSLGEYFLSHPDMKSPAMGRVYSINEGNYDFFDDSLKSYIQKCRDRVYSGRYIGSLVADFHRNLLKGGIYVYPKTPNAPEGRLRLLYECNPLAFIIEQAGGLATDGERRIMEIQPIGFHDRCGLYIGSKDMVKEAEGRI